MAHLPILRTLLRRGSAWLALGAALAVLGALPSAARSQDPIQELKNVLSMQPPFDPFLPVEQQAELLKKFHAERQQKLTKIIDTKLKTFTELRQALMLKDWGDVVKA